MKILISDFDDTLYNDKFEKNIKYIKQFIEKGNMFIIATGRSFEGVNSIIKPYKINYSYLICRDGATIYKKDELIHTNYMKSNLVENIFNEFKNHNYKNIIIDDGKEITDKICDATLIATECKNSIEDKEVVNIILKKYPNLTGYISRNHINILDKNSNKKIAIDYLVNKYKLNKNNIYTIGDHVNDIEMLKYYNGYAIVNAKEEVIKQFEQIEIKELIYKIG